MSLALLGRLYTWGLDQDAERLRAFQDRKLRRLVAHAAGSVPYYRELFDAAGLVPDDVRGVEDIAAIPSSSKADLRRWPESQRIAGTRPRLIRRPTSGSSGEPFMVLRTRGEELRLQVLRRVAMARIGARPRDHSAVLHEPSFHSRRSLLRRITTSAGLSRLHRIDAQLPREEVAAELIALSPDLVHGYASSVAQVAPVVGERAPEWRPRSVITGGEMLTAPARHRIEAGFGARAVDTYGAAECRLMAYDCPQGAETMHVCDESVILEVIRGGRPAEVGEAGDVVATALHSHLMPFLRYELGDRAVRGPCPCPCGWPGTTLLSLEGRLIEMFRLPGGRWLHPVAIIGAIAELERWVDEHRLIQEKEDLVVVQFVPLRHPSRAELDEIAARARGVLGPDVRLRVEVVPQLQEEPGPKRRPFISRLADQRLDGRQVTEDQLSRG